VNLNVKTPEIAAGSCSRRRALSLLIGACWLPGASVYAQEAQRHVAVLAYHRFAEFAADSMTVRVSTFEAQLSLLHARGYPFIRLRDIVNWLDDPRAVLPPKAIALTVDDGHHSVFGALMPIALRERLPVTLFIYPPAISNATYALTWDQLRELRRSGLFDIHSHTYWHPNFNVAQT
jgi:peptidoglycan/xylan/chitin deacetylase (PgdA/CDA1 family)